MRSAGWLFRGTIFLASLLLFLVEPITAKQLLPAFGGSAAVWLTCLAFFQTALLAGYAYAHWLSRARKAFLGLHLGLLVLSVLLAIVWAAPARGAAHMAAHPFLAIFARLAFSIGLPFFMLSTTAPLLQVWLARRSGGAVPYRLYALSNAASLLALLLYPTLVEPWLTLRVQRFAWCALFLAFAALSVLVALGSGTRKPETEMPGDDQRESPANAATRLLWFLLPLVASMQLSAVTAHLSSNVAAIPLLWVLPLAVYMITLIAAFQFPSLARHRGILLRFLVVMLTSLGYMLSKAEASLPIGISIAFFLLELLFACLFCHVEVARLRPARPDEATLFYLLFAGGGASGSFLVGIVSPLLFSGNYDLALSFLATALLAVAVTWSGGWAPRLLWVTGSLLLVFLLSLLHAAYGSGTLLATRNFYGTLRVKQATGPGGAPVRTLVNGSIQHGTQIFSDDLRTTPTTYYAADSGIGLALRSCCGQRARNVGVIGLGAGTLAAYGRNGDRMRFYEINPAVQPVAQALFTYLRESPAQISFAGGDARTSMAAEPPRHFDVLAVDAFSGDAIPLHLLTTGALALYRSHMTPCGTIAFHVSNQFVDLVPELAAVAQASAMQARSVSTPADPERGEFRATWVLLTDPAAPCDRPAVGVIVRPERDGKPLQAWTDDYSSLLPLMRW